MKEEIGEDKYSELFYKKKEIHENAMLQALDIRKFEIELYWKRAAYFWTFIAATFAGYFVLAGSTKFDDQEILLFFVNCLGLIFSFSWFLVNRGSKYWQENWEGHVDLLENIYMGPLYKTVIEKKRSHFLVHQDIT